MWCEGLKIIGAARNDGGTDGDICAYIEDSQIELRIFSA